MIKSKIIALFLVLALILSVLTACGDRSETDLPTEAPVISDVPSSVVADDGKSEDIVIL